MSYLRIIILILLASLAISNYVGVYAENEIYKVVSESISSSHSESTKTPISETIVTYMSQSISYLTKTPISKVLSEDLSETLEKFVIPPVFQQVVENLGQSTNKFLIPPVFKKVVETLSENVHNYLIPPIFKKLTEGISASIDKASPLTIFKKVVEGFKGGLPSLLFSSNESGFEVTIPNIVPDINVGFLASDVNRFLLGIAVVGISFVAHPVFALVSIIGLALSGYFGAYGFLAVFLAVAAIIFLIYIRAAGGGEGEEV